MSKGKTENTKLTTDLHAGRLMRSYAVRLNRRIALAAVISGVTVAGSMMLGVGTRSVCYGAAAGSSQQSTKGASIDIDVANAKLVSVVRLLRSESGAQIVIVNGPYQPVTLTVTASLPDALRYVASSANATVSCDANGVYTFRPANASDAAADIPPPAAPIPAAVSAPVDSDVIPASSLHTERIQLQYQDPTYVKNMVEGMGDTAPFSNPNNQILDDFSPGAKLNYGPPSVVVQQSPPASSENQQPSVPAASGNESSKGAVANFSNTGLNGDQANQFPGGGGFRGPGGGGEPGAGGFGPGAGGINGTGPNGQQGNLRPKGIDTIIANEEDNSLIVRGTAEGIQELKQIINFIDRAPQQVQVKVEFITANVADADSFGINWTMIAAPNVDTGFNGPGITGTQGSVWLSYAYGNLVAQMEALLTSSNGKVIAAPIITTTNNMPGVVELETVIPYETTTTVAQSGGNAISSANVGAIDVENELSITPRINGDNSVTMLLEPELTSVGTPTFTGGPPETSSEAVETYRTVANGDTMVLGGLVQKNETNAVERVPFLSNLPIIGSLFRTRALNTSDSELLVFVTPTILPPIGADLGRNNANSSNTMNEPAGAGTGASQYPGQQFGVTP